MGFALRFSIFFRDTDTIDQLFIPDDTYYTLSIARSLAAGEGPSADGQTQTNGFQPLLAFLLVPSFHFSSNLDFSLRWALMIAILCSTLNIYLLGCLAFRLAGEIGGIAASAIWSFSQVAIANSMGGLEASLALTFTLLLVLIWPRAQEKEGLSRLVIIGCLVGLALLARIDTIFLVFLLGLYGFIGKHRKRVLIIAFVALLVVLPWWIYSTVKFGTFIPKSGDAVHKQIEVHKATHLDAPKQIGWVTGAIIGSPFVDFKKMKEVLYAFPTLGVISGILVLFILGSLVFWAAKKKSADIPLLLFYIYGIVIVLFYTFYLPALWFMKRYLHPFYGVLTLLFAFVVSLPYKEMKKSKNFAIMLFVCFCVLFAVSVFKSLSFTWIDPDVSPDKWLHGAKGYRSVSMDILKQVPEGSVLGAFQSGALTYYAHKKIKVLNLDGVVDPFAAKAVKNKRLGEYAYARGMEYFADWDINYYAFHLFGGELIERAKFETIGVARPQGEERFIVYRVVWP